MTLKKTLGRNNPLLRRVRRHATMATLFRTVEPPSDIQSGTERSPADRLVQATLVPQTAPDGAEEAAVVPALPVQRPAETTRSGQEKPVSAQRSPAAARPARTSPPPQRTEPEPRPQKESSQEEDENWGRLQAIYDAHQRKKAAEAQQEAQAAQGPAEVTEERVQRETDEEAPRKEAADAAGDVPAPPEVSEGSPPQVDAAPHEAPETPSSPPTAGGEETTPQRKKEDAGAQVASEQPSVAGEDLVQTRAEASQTQGDAGQVRPERAGGEKSGAKEKGAAAQAAPEEKPGPAIPPDRDDAGQPAAKRDPEEQPQGPAPLEAVWPVQRKEERDESVPASDRSATQASSTPPISPEEAADREEKVRARLEHVSSGRPSDSSVQLVPPRRPRPPIPAKDVRQEDVLSQREDVLSQREDVLSQREDVLSQREDVLAQREDVLPQREDVLSQRDAEPPQRDAGAPPAEEETEISAEQTTAVQRRQEPAPEAAETTAGAEAETISTEIGPLPADLWQLLGQEPPSQAAEAQGSTPPPQPPEAPETDDTVMRAIARSEGPSEPPSPAEEDEKERPTPDLEPQSSSAPPLQRQVETDAAPEAEGGASAGPEAAVEEEVEAAEVDVDELARRVYSDVKRRLAVEWERVRGRL